MREADVPIVMAIEAGAYDYPWTPGIFRDCLRAGYQCWVLELGDDFFSRQILGYGVLSVASDEAHVLNVCIAREQQGQGHGRRVLRWLIDLARRQRVQRIFLEVRPSNAAALTLYRDEGFHEIGRRPRYYPTAQGREDALVLARELLYDVV